MNYYTNIVKLFCYLYIASFLASCSTAQMGQQLSPDTNYREEIPITVDGSTWTVGAVVLPIKPAYTINFQTKDKPVVITAGTCHREITPTPGQTQYSFIYAPTNLELADSCPLHISTYSSKIWYRGATIVFENPAIYSVQGAITCNGAPLNANGMGLCQAKAGLLEEVDFVNPMNIGTPKIGCAMPTPSPDFRKWVFTVSSGECQYKFGEKTAPSANQFLMTFDGYDNYLMPQGS